MRKFSIWSKEMKEDGTVHNLDYGIVSAKGTIMKRLFGIPFRFNVYDSTYKISTPAKKTASKIGFKADIPSEQ